MPAKTSAKVKASGGPGRGASGGSARPNSASHRRTPEDCAARTDRRGDGGGQLCRLGGRIVEDARDGGRNVEQEHVRRDAVHHERVPHVGPRAVPQVADCRLERRPAARELPLWDESRADRDAAVVRPPRAEGGVEGGVEGGGGRLGHAAHCLPGFSFSEKNSTTLN